MGLAAVAHLGRASLGVHGGLRRFVGVDTWVATAQVEAHVTPELSFVAMGNREASTVFGEVLRAGLGARAFPVPSLAIDLGVGFDRLGDDTVFGNDHSDPYLGVEWRLPLPSDDWPLSLFLERQISTLDLVGLRLSHGAGKTPRDVDRREGWRRLR